MATNKIAVTVHLPESLVDELKNAAYYMPGETITNIVAIGTLKRLAELVTNASKDEALKGYTHIPKGGCLTFKKRKAELKCGRPVKVSR